jgi:hypothetical protein
VLNGIYFCLMIQLRSEHYSRCMMIPRTLSSLKPHILALLLCMNWNFGMASGHAHSFSMKVMQSSSLWGSAHQVCWSLLCHNCCRHQRYRSATSQTPSRSLMTLFPLSTYQLPSDLINLLSSPHFQTVWR